MNNIGKRIKDLRRKNDLTQEKLAEYLGVTDKAVSKWECGMTMPDLTLIVPMARLLNVTADELLSGNPGETDQRRAEFDRHCDDWTSYTKEESYRMAVQATTEYPADYRYLLWLAQTEQNMAYLTSFKEDPQAEYSRDMMERAIVHNSLVLHDCGDAELRENAIWNIVVCCKCMKQYGRAKLFAEMLPEETSRLTRDKAMELCLQGEALAENRKMAVYRRLTDLCIYLSRIYYFAEKPEPYVQAAMDTTEAVLKAVFPDGNYLWFCKYICCVYQQRAAFAVLQGEEEKAVDYLRTMLDYARKIPHGEAEASCGVLAGLSVEDAGQLPYVLVGLDDLSMSAEEQLRNRIRTCASFAPLWEREDFQAL